MEAILFSETSDFPELYGVTIQNSILFSRFYFQHAMGAIIDTGDLVAHTGFFLRKVAYSGYDIPPTVTDIAMVQKFDIQSKRFT
jgi:hypothetical protein